MTFFETYLDKINSRNNMDLAISIKKTVDYIAPKYFEKFSFFTNEVGLLFGNIQSGKTGQMFGLICSATDKGFPIFIILTTDNVALQQQTIKRVKEDLDNYCICDEYDTEIFTENELMKPTIIVLKKNMRTLKQWSNLMASTGFMKGNPLFIVDDEADAASLNTLVNKEKTSTINHYIDELKSRSASSIYLQVTGTPQALLLQSKISGWHPYFTYYFKPGRSYLGGDFFFSKERKNTVKFIDEIKSPLKDAIYHHLVATAQIFLSGGNVCNFLIHPSVKKAVHNEFKIKVKKAINEFKINCNSLEFEKKLKEMYLSEKPKNFKNAEFDEVLKFVKILLLEDKINVFVMNASNRVESEEYADGSNIIIGGNTLGRGVTFSKIQTIYYTRTAKKPQADTMWQHSRMFGYDRDAGMMKVYLDKNLYKLFSDINATNNSIIAQVEKGIEDIKIYYPPKLNPTRKNVLDKGIVFAVSGGANYYPFNPKNDSINDLNKLLELFKDDEAYYQVNMRLIKEILSHIVSDADFSIKVFDSILNMLIAEKPLSQAILIVRRNRNVAKGTGALLSPNDWKLGATIKDKVVLTMYQMTGDKGWNGEKMWVPNIKLPDNIVYYDIKE